MKFFYWLPSLFLVAILSALGLYAAAAIMGAILFIMAFPLILLGYRVIAKVLFVSAIALILLYTFWVIF